MWPSQIFPAVLLIYILREPSLATSIWILGGVVRVQGSCVSVCEYSLFLAKVGLTPTKKNSKGGGEAKFIVVFDWWWNISLCEKSFLQSQWKIFIRCWLMSWYFLQSPFLSQLCKSKADDVLHKLFLHEHLG